jgi:hypothetical protein
MRDPMDFFSTDFTGIEASEGLIPEVVPAQWAKLLYEEVTYGTSKNTGTPEMTCRMRLDAKFAKTPKLGFFWRWYLTEAMEPQIVGITKAAAGFRTTKRFGKPTGASDNRDKYEGAEFEEAAKALATVLKGKAFIGKIGVEVDPDGVYADKNRVQNCFVASTENLEAIAAGGFEVSGVGYKTRKLSNGASERYLVPKGAKSASGSSGDSGLD